MQSKDKVFKTKIANLFTHHFLISCMPNFRSGTKDKIMHKTDQSKSPYRIYI